MKRIYAVFALLVFLVACGSQPASMPPNPTMSEQDAIATINADLVK